MSWRERIPSRLQRSALWTFGREVRLSGLGFTLLRRRIWPGILGTAAIHTQQVCAREPIETHLMCCERDYLSAVWALKSFYCAARVTYPLVIHLQGLMPARAHRALAVHFPEALIIPQHDADEAIEPQLRERGLHHLLEARQRSPVMMKLIDVVLLGSARGILCLDSDLLFFRYPARLAIADVPARSVFMRDVSSGYSISLDRAVSALQVRLAPAINTGIMLFRREHVSLERCESFLMRLDLPTYDGLIEQTLYALCASERGDVEYLPDDYVISMQPGPDNVVARHYAGPSRALLTTEGMPRLLKAGLLEQRAPSTDNLSVLESKKTRDTGNGKGH
jgi:hypothetical protein